MTTLTPLNALPSRTPMTAPDPFGHRLWATEAVQRCVGLCSRQAPRYARHLWRAQIRRDPFDDLLVLAARRQLPLGQRVLRPLPGATLVPAARAFNSLVRADRRALLMLFAQPSAQPAPEPRAREPRAGESRVPESRGPAPSQRESRAREPPALAAALGEHRASALARLVEGTLAQEVRAVRFQQRPGCSARPPP